MSPAKEEILCPWALETVVSDSRISLNSVNTEADIWVAAKLVENLPVSSQTLQVQQTLPAADGDSKT